jgi:hypothetical protein
VTGVLIVFGIFIWVTIFDIDLDKLAFEGSVVRDPRRPTSARRVPVVLIL